MKAELITQEIDEFDDTDEEYDDNAINAFIAQPHIIEQILRSVERVENGAVGTDSDVVFARLRERHAV